VKRIALVFLSTCLLARGGALRAATSTAPEEEPRPKTLFERIGGTYVLASVVDEFVDALYRDPTIQARPAIHRALRVEHKAGFKFQMTSLLCQETGGPCKYDGRSMREAHRDLGLTSREWEAAVAAFKRALVRAQVPAAERQELLNLLGTTKGDIVLSPAAK
jgi:hemoglobin